MTRKLTFLILALFALISGPGWGQNYQLVTSTGDLVAGCNYVIGNGNSGSVKFMSTEANTNNRKVTEGITVSTDGEVTIDNTVLKLELGGTTGAWTLKTTNYLGTNGYLASAASGSNNYCRVIADKTTATISFSDDAAVITIQPHTSRNILRYNSSASCFACYSSGQDAVYLYKEITSSKTLTSLAVSGTPTKTTYEAGEEFAPAGLVVTGTYDDTSTAEITSGITWTVTPSPLTAGTTSVSVTATVGEITSPEYVVDGLTVTEFVQTYANTYTSDASLSTLITGNKVKWEGCKETSGYEALKIAKGGTASIIVPAGTKTVHLHMVAWNGESAAVTVKLGTTTLSSITPTADAGVSGSATTFTIATEPKTENSYYFAIEVNTNEASTLSLTTASNKRAILFGVNFEEASTTDPVINASNVNLAYGAISGEIAYSIINPIEGQSLIAELTEGDWISNVAVDATNNKVTFTSSANTTHVERTATITLSYDGADNKDVTVTQNGAPYTLRLSSNGVVGTPQQGASITLDVPTNVPTGFSFAGWTESESDIRFVANPYTPTSDVTLYAVFSRVEGGTAGSGNYEKVTVQLTDWRGDYLIAYSDEVFMDGSLAGGTNGVGKAQTHVSPESALSGNTISAAWGDEHYVTIEAIDDADLTKGYVIKSHSTTTPYFYQTTNDNGMACTANKSTAAAYPITVTLNTENDVRIALGGKATGAVLRYNNTSGSTGEMFRYYKNCGQQPIYLYKKDAGAPGTTHHYTRVFLNETAEAIIIIGGPSIIPAGSTLNMGTNTLVNENAANLVIEDGGQIIRSDEGTVNATFKKHIEGYTANQDNYYLIAAPIANASIEGLTTNSYDLYSYDEPTHCWFNQEGTNTFSSLSLGQGYLYANSTTGDVTISGTISNNQNPTIDVTASSDNLTGFNLVGNPFSYNLSISDMAMMDDDTEIYDITSIYQISGTAVVASQNTSVAPCEGFFIQAPVAGELYFNAGSSRSEKSSVSDLKVEVKESTRSAQLLDRAYVNFSESRPMNKFYMNENSTRLYIPQNGKDYAVVMANAINGELPVNFKAEKDGTYTITVNTENVEANYLHLIDNLTGMDTDLLSTPSYTFDAKTSDYASRFKLVFGVKNDNKEMSQANSFAYINNGEIVISNEGRATLQVIDVLGRIISSEEINGEYRISTEGMTAGLYILNLNGMTQKIVVR